MPSVRNSPAVSSSETPSARGHAPRPRPPRGRKPGEEGPHGVRSCQAPGGMVGAAPGPSLPGRVAISCQELPRLGQAGGIRAQSPSRQPYGLGSFSLGSKPAPGLSLGPLGLRGGWLGSPGLHCLPLSFQTWLRSYMKLFQAPCQRCGKFLQDGLPPTWRDFRTLEAFHDTCRQ